MFMMCQLQTVIEQENKIMFYKPGLVKFSRRWCCVYSRIQRFQPFVMLMFSKQKRYSFTQQHTPSISYRYSFTPTMNTNRQTLNKLFGIFEFIRLTIKITANVISITFLNLKKYHIVC